MERRNTLKLLLRYARSYMLWFIALVILIVVQGCAQLFGLTREMKNIVDQGIQTGDMNYIMHSGLRMLVFTALVAVCGALIAWLGGRISCGMRKDMMRDCYKKILSFSPQDEAGFGGATLLTRCITDTENIQRLLGAWNTHDGVVNYESIYDLYALLDTLPSQDGWKQFAEDLGMTMEDTKALMNSALAAERFSKAMGMTVDQFSAGWNQDAAAQMLSFFRTLGEMDGTSDEENMLWVMDQLGIKEIRQSNMVRALANNWELYANMLQLGRDAYEENIALENEANRAFSTNESRRTMNQNKEQNALEAMGETVTAMRKPFEDFFGDLKQWYADWPTWAQAAVAGAAEVMGRAGNVLNIAGIQGRADAE